MSQNIEKSQKLSVSCINKKMKFLSPHYSGGYKFYQQVWKKKLLNIPIKYITKIKIQNSPFHSYIITFSKEQRFAILNGI